MKLRGFLGALAVLLTSVALAPPASAAGQVRIYQQFYSPELYLESSLSFPLSGISILTDGALGFTFNSPGAPPGIPNLSSVDSVYIANAIPGTSLASLSMVSINLGVALFDPFTGPVRLGTFSLFSPYDRVSLFPGETEIPGFGPAFGATLYDLDLNPIVASSISVDPYSGALTITVPEPFEVTLLSLAAAVAAFVRVSRSARASLRERK